MASENFLSTINSVIQIMKEKVCVVDTTGKILALNDTFKKNFNLSSGEKLPFYLLDNNTLKEIKNNEGETLNKEVDNSLLLKSYIPLFQSDRFVGIVCQFKHSSVQTEINEKIKSDEKFTSLFEQASDAIMITDFKGSVIDANASFCNMFGYAKEEIINMNISALIDKTDLTERPLNFDNINSGHRVFSQRRMIHRDGRFIYVEANLKKFGENQIMAIVKDITEIKNAKTQIENSEAQFKGAFENAAIGMALVSLEGTWLKINKEFCTMLGYEETELLKLSFKDFTHPEDFSNCLINILQIIKGEKEAWRTDKRYQHKNGHYIWINFSASMVRDTKNNPLFIVSQFENISKRKESEMQKEKMTKDLLLQNKNLEQFAYIVSHNLRAPVANIIGLSGLLKDEAYPIEIRNQCIDELEASTQRLDNIIHDLNNILQIKREITEKKEEVIFEKMVDHISSSIQNLIIKEKVKIHTDFRKLETTITLKSYLYSIFYNLITNSIKYRHPERTPIINISSELIKDKIVLHFSDNGMGIDMEKYGEHLFGLYKRFHLQLEGKGMGLFVVKTQVETLGGNIYASSKVNEGLYFKIELPQ